MITKIPVQKRAVLERLPKNSIGVEIGVAYGTLSEAIINLINPKMFYLIDCWQKHNKEGWNVDPMFLIPQEEWDLIYHDDILKKFLLLDNVKIVKAFSEEVYDIFPDEYFDWIYIDADHSYQSCLNDLNNWWNKLKIGGWFLGDDFYNDGWVHVEDAVCTFMKQREIEKLDLRVGNDWGIIKKIV